MSLAIVHSYYRLQLLCSKLVFIMSVQDLNMYCYSVKRRWGDEMHAVYSNSYMHTRIND